MGLRVLLAEDSPAVRQALRALLEQAGIAVACEAADGEEAMELWRMHHLDVAILDFCMPRWTGLDVARKLLHGASDTAVIILTLHTEEARIAAALQAGVRGYVDKARAPEDLIPAIHAVAEGRVYLSPCIDHLRSTHPGTEGVRRNLRQAGTAPPDAAGLENEAPALLPTPK